MKNGRNFLFLILLATITFAGFSCSQKTHFDTRSAEQTVELPSTAKRKRNPERIIDTMDPNNQISGGGQSTLVEPSPVTPTIIDMHSHIRQIAASLSECPNGGTVIQNWIESSGNTSPDTVDELNSLQELPVCQPSTTATHAVSVVDAGSNCEFGGLTVESWLDINNNGTYEPTVDTSFATSNLCQDDPAVPSAKLSTISHGGLTACGILTDATVTCWGYQDGNGYFGVNNYATYSKYKPDGERVRIWGSNNILTGVTKIATGMKHSCAVASGSVYCWGDNTYGQLGDGTTITKGAAVLALGISNAKQVAVGRFHSCAVLNDGGLKCWGNNTNGQIGNGQSADNSFPQSVVNVDKDVTQVAAGSYQNCVLKTDGKVYCWGFENSGQHGIGSIATPTTILSVPVSGLTDVTSISGGLAYPYDHTCAVLISGKVRCWGNGAVGQLGNGASANSAIPVAVLLHGVELTDITNVAVGSGSTCALSTDGGTYCWGYNGWGELGINSTLLQNTAVRVMDSAGTGFLSGIASIACGGGWADNNFYARCSAIDTSGKGFSWGQNAWGQLGVNNATDSKLPMGIVY